MNGKGANNSDALKQHHVLACQAESFLSNCHNLITEQNDLSIEKKFTGK